MSSTNSNYENYRYKVYINTPELGVQQCGTLQIRQRGERLMGTSFKYHRDYIENDAAFALDPGRLRLDYDERLFFDAEAPLGFIDDYLPDSWGRKVLTTIYTRRARRAFNANKLSDMLAVLGPSRIGALRIVPFSQEEPPDYIGGADSTLLETAELTAQQLDTGEYDDITLDELSLMYLGSNGTGVGGARPKALIRDDGNEYLAKFNRRIDLYNMAKTELACLSMAKSLGLCQTQAHLRTGSNGREILMQERFDIVNNARRHLITVNALRKDRETQRDSGLRFTYDAIVELLEKYSCQFAEDLAKLVTLMLFNRAIHNTDDHERNFSLWHNGKGYALAPAYDMVPTLDAGGYHTAEFNYSPYPPKTSELIAKPVKLFGLSKTEVATIAEKVNDTVSRWESYAEAAGLSEEESSKIQRVFCL